MDNNHPDPEGRIWRDTSQANEKIFLNPSSGASRDTSASSQAPLSMGGHAAQTKVVRSENRAYQGHALHQAQGTVYKSPFQPIHRTKPRVLPPVFPRNGPAAAQPYPTAPQTSLYSPFAPPGAEKAALPSPSPPPPRCFPQDRAQTRMAQTSNTGMENQEHILAFAPEATSSQAGHVASAAASSILKRPLASQVLRPTSHGEAFNCLVDEMKRFISQHTSENVAPDIVHALRETFSVLGSDDYSPEERVNHAKNVINVLPSRKKRRKEAPDQHRFPSQPEMVARPSHAPDAPRELIINPVSPGVVDHRRDEDERCRLPSRRFETGGSFEDLKKAAARLSGFAHPIHVARGASPERPTDGPPKLLQVADARMRERHELGAVIRKRMASAVLFLDINDESENDGPYHVVFRSPPEDPSIPVAHLSKACMHRFENLLNSRGELHEKQAEILRYLWVMLVVKAVTGTVLCGAMGVLRIQQVTAFVVMYLDKASKDNRVLIVVPETSESEWAEALRNYKVPFSFVVLPDKTRNPSIRSLEKWNSEGGLLVISEDCYEEVLTSSSTKELALRLLVKPGPNVVILDQASRFHLMNNTVKRSLRRTETKSRLALTGISLGGNLETIWHILDWACPDLLGDIDEHRSVLVNKIAVGHQIYADSYLGRVAFRAAAYFYKYAHPVLLPSCGQFDFVKYETRNLRSNSVTVYTNLSNKETSLYNSLRRVFSKMIASRTLSPFVAAHVLTVCATNAKALESLLESSTEVRSRGCLASVRLKDQLDKLKITFKEALKILRSKMGSNLKRESTKFSVVRHLFKKCCASHAKMVAFTGSMEVQAELFGYLDKVGRQSGAVFNYSLRDTDAIRSKNLKEFREVGQGACLVAPYGPTAACRESAGWADLDVSIVVVVDSGWHAVAEAQCVKRIKSLLDGHKPKNVLVVNLVARQTVEEKLYKSVLDVYESERQRCRAIQQVAGSIPDFDTVPERSFLAKAEIQNEFLNVEVGNAIHRGLEDDENTMKLAEMLKRKMNCLRELSQVKVAGMPAVHLVSAKLDRVNAVSLFTEMCTRARPNEDVTRKAEYDLVKSLGELAKRRDESISEIDMYPFIDTPLENPSSAFLACREDAKPSDLGLSPHELSFSCTLAAVWEPYYDLYERDDSLRIRPPAHNRRNEHIRTNAPCE